MLSEIIKKKIEEKSGIKIRYSRDCDILANEIFKKSNCKLSASTIRRLFGFIKSEATPRVYSLDVIAIYLDYPSWDDLIQSLNKSETVTSKIITEIKSSKIKKGDKYQYSCKPSVVVSFECIGNSKFKVIEAKNSQLLKGDLFTASLLALHHPLFILDVERDGKQLGRLIEAKISGITSINKL